MSKILNNTNQKIAWNTAGFDGDPSVDITMMDVYEWEEEVMECQNEIREKLDEILRYLEDDIREEEEFIRSEREKLLVEEKELEDRKTILHEILMNEGYPNGLYLDDDEFSIAA